MAALERAKLRSRTTPAPPPPPGVHGPAWRPADVAVAVRRALVGGGSGRPGGVHLAELYHALGKVSGDLRWSDLQREWLVAAPHCGPLLDEMEQRLTPRELDEAWACLRTAGVSRASPRRAAPAASDPTGAELQRLRAENRRLSSQQAGAAGDADELQRLREENRRLSNKVAELTRALAEATGQRLASTPVTAGGLRRLLSEESQLRDAAAESSAPLLRKDSSRSLQRADSSVQQRSRRGSHVSFAPSPEDPRVAELFSRHDRDHDGYWNYAEACEYAAATSGCPLTAADWAAECAALGADPALGLDIHMVTKAFAGQLPCGPPPAGAGDAAPVVRLSSSQRRATELLAANTDHGVKGLYWRKLEGWRELRADHRRQGYALVDPCGDDTWQNADEPEEEEEWEEEAAPAAVSRKSSRRPSCGSLASHSAAELVRAVSGDSRLLRRGSRRTSCGVPLDSPAQSQRGGLRRPGGDRDARKMSVVISEAPFSFHRGASEGSEEGREEAGALDYDTMKDTEKAFRWFDADRDGLWDRFEARHFAVAAGGGEELLDWAAEGRWAGGAGLDALAAIVAPEGGGLLAPSALHRAIAHAGRVQAQALLAAELLQDGRAPLGPAAAAWRRWRLLSSRRRVQRPVWRCMVGPAYGALSGIVAERRRTDPASLIVVSKEPGGKLGAAWEGNSTKLKSARPGGALHAAGGAAAVGRVLTHVNNHPVLTAEAVGAAVGPLGIAQLRFAPKPSFSFGDLVLHRSGEEQVKEGGWVLAAGAAATVRDVRESGGRCVLLLRNAEGKDAVSYAEHWVVAKAKELEDQRRKDRLAWLFRRFDTNRDGLWNRREMGRFLLSATGATLSPEDWADHCAQHGADPAVGMTLEQVSASYGTDGVDEDYEAVQRNEDRLRQRVSELAERNAVLGPFRSLERVYEQADERRRQQQESTQQSYQMVDPTAEGEWEHAEEEEVWEDEEEEKWEGQRGEGEAETAPSSEMHRVPSAASKQTPSAAPLEAPGEQLLHVPSADDRPRALSLLRAADVAVDTVRVPGRGAALMRVAGREEHGRSLAVLYAAGIEVEELAASELRRASGTLSAPRSRRASVASAARSEQGREGPPFGRRSCASSFASQSDVVRAVSAGDLRRLSKASLRRHRTAHLFSLFDRDGDGRWSHAEARRFALASGGIPCDYSEWSELCRGLGADPAAGLDLEQVAKAYADAEGFDDDYEAVVRRLDESERRATQLLAGTTAHGTLCVYYRRLEYWRDLCADRRRQGYKLVDPTQTVTGTAPDLDSTAVMETERWEAPTAEGVRQARIAFLFKTFDRDGDGRWNHSEMRRFALASGGVPCDYSEWSELCRGLGADPAVGLDLDQVTRAYGEAEGIDDDYEAVLRRLDESERRATQLLAGTTAHGTLCVYYRRLEYWRDLRADRRRQGYKMLDPTQTVSSTMRDLDSTAAMETERWEAPPVEAVRTARIAFLFRHFDQDGDGLWSYPEARRFSIASCGTPLERSEWEGMCAELGADPARGIDIAAVAKAYGGDSSIDDDYEAIVARLEENERRVRTLVASCTEQGLVGIYYRKLEGWHGEQRDRQRQRYALVDPTDQPHEEVQEEEEEWEDEPG
eukprot:TRINITY_DN1300_c0_g2_i4.p1 TRINITY_DN1300_c0_g2~~TRINITY_DN1300_c0_g2_i4.p1  ORF type:complete len:1632 (+),score=517.57 TRINITY_DN1300_c0_g2_i4:77-4897(+)